MKIALIQFDAVPERPEQNLNRMAELVEAAAGQGARWIQFHEGTLCDYSPALEHYAEPVPTGRATQRMSELARRFDCVVSFGLTEVDNGRFFITQVFVGPSGFLYRYRKTWLWREESDTGYRNEWARYDPGTGPELFTVDGIAATCFICADGEAPRCIERAAALRPQVVFYPNNREELPLEAFAERARWLGAPLLVTNRTGLSWGYDCRGGSTLFSASGAVLAQANREGREEILVCNLRF